MMLKRTLTSVLYRIGLVSCLLVLDASAGISATLQVRCPSNSITAKVTSKLSDGWWATPQGARLGGVTVINVGGEWSLLCLYLNAQRKEIGVLRPYPPTYRRCHARKAQLDFICSK